MESRQTRVEAQVVHHTFSGQITAHRGRGRTMDVPTLNILAPLEVPDGVYAGFVRTQQHRWPAALFVGAAITFGETERQAEAHLLDAEVDLTGVVTFELTHFIRPNQRYADASALQAQMRLDLIQIRQCLQASSKN